MAARPSTNLFTSQGQGAMDDYLFPQRGRHDLVTAGEGLEDALGHEFVQRLEEQLFPNERYAPSYHDAPRTEQGDDVTDSFREAIEGQIDHFARRRIPT